MSAWTEFFKGMGSILDLGPNDYSKYVKSDREAFLEDMRALSSDMKIACGIFLKESAHAKRPKK